MSYFGESDSSDQDALAQRVGSERLKAPGYLRPMTPYGDTYTPSYTKFLNAPGSSYTHPLHQLFNDRRPVAPKIRTTLRTPPGA